MKKKTLVPLIIFYWAYALLVSLYTKQTPTRRKRHITAQLNATTYGERIKMRLRVELRLRML